MDNFLPPEIRELRENGDDFYIETKMTVESYLQIVHLQTEVREEAEKLKVPVLMVNGTADSTADVAFSENYLHGLENVKVRKSVRVPGDHFGMCWEDTYEAIQDEIEQFMRGRVNFTEVDFRRK